MFELIRENLFAHTVFVQRQTAGMRVIDLAGRGRALLVDSGLESDTFNRVLWMCTPDLQTAPPLFPGQDIDQIDADCLKALQCHTEETARDFPVWAGDADRVSAFAPESNLDRLKRFGYIPFEQERAMFLRREAVEGLEQLQSGRLVADPDGVWIDPVNGLQIVRVRTPVLLDAFADVLAANWTPPDDDVHVFFHKAAPLLLDADTPMRLFVGIAGDSPVCCGELFLSHHGQVAGLHMLVTRTGCRGNGFGFAMSRALLAAAPHSPLAVLLASAEGEALYRRLGFVPCGLFAECLPVALP